MKGDKRRHAEEEKHKVHNQAGGDEVSVAFRQARRELLRFGSHSRQDDEVAEADRAAESNRKRHQRAINDVYHGECIFQTNVADIAGAGRVWQ